MKTKRRPPSRQRISDASILLHCIRHTAHKTFAPSYRQLGARFNLHIRSVEWRIQHLLKLGVICAADQGFVLTDEFKRELTPYFKTYSAKEQDKEMRSVLKVWEQRKRAEDEAEKIAASAPFYSDPDDG